ncbi:MAG: DNA repair protein RecO [Aerococcaceae bacterium]|nr:DNA repair protein RecO [Aerococcaceae bacterium]
MQQSFDGIVLFKRPYREKDLLIKVFTEHAGTKMFFVGRAQEQNYPLAPQIVPLTHNHYVGAIHNQGFSFIQEGQTVQFFRKIQEDYWLQAYAVYISQLIDAAVDDNTPHAALYQLLRDSLSLLEKGLRPEVVVAYVEIHLLSQFGLALDWQHCCECHQLAPLCDFSMIKQGILCEKHWATDAYRLRISPKAMYIAKQLASISIRQIQSVNVSDETLQELRRLMDEIYKEFVGIRLKSKSYLDQMTQLSQLKIRS